MLSFTYLIPLYMAQRDSDYVVLALNKKAMDFLRTEDFKSTLLYLKKAEALLSSAQFLNSKKLYALTLNNFGCYYKRTDNLKVALSFLNKALEVESQPPVDINNLSGTHLNICAILSTMNEHTKALAHSLKALNLLKSKYLEDPSLLTLYIAAHHNTGLEFENIDQVSEAENIYKKGYQIAVQSLGSSHPLTCSLKQSIFDLRKNQVDDRWGHGKASPVNRSKTLLAGRNKSVNRPNASKFRSRLLKRIEKIRFITGDRLQPMFRKEEIRVEEFNKRTGYEVKRGVSESFSERTGEGDEEVQAKAQKLLYLSESEVGGETTEELKAFKGVQVSIATQVQMFDSNYLLDLKNKAAVRIQKHVKGFLARRRTEYFKYQRILREAEKQAKRAKESLKRLRARKATKPIKDNQTINTELVPIAYKDKLESPTKTSSTWTGKPYSKLTTITEEDNEIAFKVVVIQKNFKGWKARKSYLIQRKAAVIIQKHVRRYQVQKLYLKIKEAIVFIQRVWRLYLKKFKLVPRKRIPSTVLKNKNKKK